MRTEHCLLLNHSRLRVRFGASKTGLSPPVKFLLLTILRRFYCDSVYVVCLACQLLLYTLNLYLHVVEGSRMATFLGKS